MSFHEVLDDIFDKIKKNYEDNNDNIIEKKNKLLYIYENEDKLKCKEILKTIKPKNMYIDANGNVINV